MKHEQVGFSMGVAVPRLGNFADISSIKKEIATYVESILPRINIEDISDTHAQTSLGFIKNFYDTLQIENTKF